MRANVESTRRVDGVFSEEPDEAEELNEEWWSVAWEAPLDEGTQVLTN